MIAYLVLTGAIVAVFAAKIEHSALIFTAHVLGIGLIAGYRGFVFRHWYPLPYIALCYREMSMIIGSVRTASADELLAGWDAAIWHADPVLWLGLIESPLLTELTQVAYALFVPAVLLVAVILWREKRFVEFRGYAFLLTLGFLVSYLGYLLVPARGPRFFLPPLHGLWLYPHVRQTLDVLESAHYDCFPSGHVEMTVLAWWGARRISARLGWIYAGYIAITIFATVYLRYHYSVDVMAGLAVAAVILAGAPRLMRKLDGGEPPDNTGRG